VNALGKIDIREKSLANYRIIFKILGKKKLISNLIQKLII
jgi:hypothetical protein